ncbi:MAG: hypothetical protein JWR90_3953 [Marmoricola sp.]|nr:hypothetical protein [Marmoricola sp.]
MFDLINGIPVHPLVVHAVVVLLPLAILGTIVIAVVPRWRTPYGPLVVVTALVATALIPVATSSGEELERRVGDPGKHAALGDQLIWFAIPLLVLVAALVLLQRIRDHADLRPTAEKTTGRRVPGTTLVVTVAVLAALAAVASGVQVYRVGDSGAKAVWSDQVKG